MSVDAGDMDAFSLWAHAANALCFLPEGTICDPNGYVLVYPGPLDPEPDALSIPYPRDAALRKARTWSADCPVARIEVMDGLPPVIGEQEVELRDAPDVAFRRSLALFVACARAESLTTGNPIPADEMKTVNSPIGFDCLTPAERAFVDTDAPDEEDVQNMAWRLPRPWPSCNGRYGFPTISRGTSGISRRPPGWAALSRAATSPSSFGAPRFDRPRRSWTHSDLHYRLHSGGSAEPNSNSATAPSGIEGDVISERHHALNWLVRGRAPRLGRGNHADVRRDRRRTSRRAPGTRTALLLHVRLQTRQPSVPLLRRPDRGTPETPRSVADRRRTGFPAPHGHYARSRRPPAHADAW